MQAMTLSSTIPAPPGSFSRVDARKSTIFLSNGLTRKIIGAKFLNAGWRQKATRLIGDIKEEYSGECRFREARALMGGIREEFFQRKNRIVGRLLGTSSGLRR